MYNGKYSLSFTCGHTYFKQTPPVNDHFSKIPHFFQSNHYSRAVGRWGGGVRWVRAQPLTRRKGPLNLRGRVKMTLRTCFFKISRRNISPDPPLHAHMLPVLAPTVAKSCLRPCIVGNSRKRSQGP